MKNENISQKYAEINRKLWNSKTKVHVSSAFYQMEAFKEGTSSLKSIELGLLDDISSLKVLHLQCHFGQDTLSLARMGAEVLGVDLSDEAISVARKLNEELRLNARFLQCNVLELKEHLEEQFDVIFTSYGVLGWLPDLNAWAEVVQHFLKPNGKLVLVEFHPVLWLFDDDFIHIKYSYFKGKAINETEQGTYANPDAEIENEYVEWEYSIGELLSALLDQGLQIQHFQEYDYSPYDCFKKAVSVGEDRWQVEGLQEKIPMTFSLVATK